MIEKIEQINNWLINVRRDLHQSPELGLKEFVTKQKIIKYLDEIKIEYKTFKNHTGVMAYINTKNAEKTIAIRADIDALPIEEKTNLPYKSKNKNCMHACGHDAHTAILLGVCKICFENKDKLNVNLKFLFQPAEETVGGAKLLINDGCLKNPKVDYILGLHVDPNLEVGKVEFKYDTLNASSDSVIIKIKGKKSHGAYPHQGTDAIVALSSVITSLQSLISRNLSPTNPAVLSFGTINGGFAQNIICDEVILKGTLRTLNEETRDFCKNRITQIVKNVSSAYLCESEIYFEKGYDALINDNFVVDILKSNLKNFLNQENIITRKNPSLGVEDFSFFLNETKGAFYHIGCKNESKNIIFPLHSDKFNIDEDCLKFGVLVHILNIFALS